MKKSVIIGIIGLVIIILGVGGYLVYKNITAPEVEEGVVPAPSTEVQIYKGIWTPTYLTEDSDKLTSYMQEMKDLGMNMVFIPGSPPHAERCLEGVDPNSNIAKKMKKILPIERKILIENIQTIHRNGLKVGLTVSKCMPAAENISIEDWNSKVVEYAKLAEEYGVELFAPMNEPEALFGPSASATWGQEILPKIREVYHGIVIWKGASIGDIQPYPMTELAPTNYSGYDYLGFSLSVGPGKTVEQFSQRADYILDTFLGLAERDSCKGVMISEFYGNLPYRWEERNWNEEKEARANEIILEKGSKYDKIVGFIALDFLGMSNFGEDIPGMPDPKRSPKTKEMIRKYFTEILK